MNNLKILMRINGDMTHGDKPRYWKVDTGFGKWEVTDEEAQEIADKLAEVFEELHGEEVSTRIQ